MPQSIESRFSSTLGLCISFTLTGALPAYSLADHSLMTHTLAEQALTEQAIAQASTAQASTTKAQPLADILKDSQASGAETLAKEGQKEIPEEGTEEVQEENTDSLAESLDLEPSIIENSPVLQRWLNEVPDVLSDIEHDPSFRPRIRAGYSQGWSDGESGFIVGIEDVFLGATGLTVSGDYQGEWDGGDEQYGLDLRYYLLPLGKSVNIAPVLGYRHVNEGPEDLDGANVGVRLLLVPGRTGAADLSLTQTWLDPGSDRALSRFTLSAGYALTPGLRLSTDVHVQTSDRQSQTDVGLLLEWLL